MRITFLGTGAAGGVPLYGCRCEACTLAMENPALRRAPCSALIETGDTRILIDGGLMDLHTRFAPGELDAILLTHFHPDHVQGLFHLRWGRGPRIPVLIPPDPDGCADLFRHPGILDFQPQTAGRHHLSTGPCPGRQRCQSHCQWHNNVLLQHHRWVRAGPPQPRHCARAPARTRGTIAAIQLSGTGAHYKRDLGDRQTGELARQARQAGVSLSSHDDHGLDDVERNRVLGTSIAEFPMDAETASASREAGVAVLMGAPNLVRGGSHVGAISVRDAITGNLVDILCSDYHYPSLFRAPFVAAEHGLLPLEQAWKMVSENPAKAAGLGASKGRIEPGFDADLLLLSELDGSPLSLQSTLVGGRLVFRRG